MYSSSMEEIVNLHIQERHREAARYRLGHPRNASRRPSWRAARARNSKRPREQCAHA
jgi:hypothetical protein